MSTRAVIEFENETYFYIERDGYPSTVIGEELNPMVKKAKEFHKKIPEISILRFIKMLIREDAVGYGSFFLETAELPDNSLNYVYRIQEDGNVQWRYEEDKNWEEYIEEEE